ncbi:hypothetical protein [Endozoicomonas arenosclerae]|uniref:hypothetical protein n=1 Tax=Endozoicomonas arenosclerae TaxID=1633495 RepID=UPI00078120C3|nr:hypothetical protein [Endozoicomonas arenosclerae]
MKLLSSSLFLVCLSALTAEVSASSSCTTADSAYPRGSYLNELQLRKAKGQKGQEIKVATEARGKVITYGTSSLENTCHFVERGFDIQLAGNKLVFKPGQRMMASQYITSLKLENADSEDAWYRPSAWIPFYNWQSPALNHASDIPGTCDFKRTYLTRDTGLIEAECESISKKKIRTIMPTFEVCDANQGLLNFNGQLVCRSTFASLIQYSFYIGRLLGSYNINHLPAEHYECASADGDYIYVATADHSRQIDGLLPIYFRTSGFYLCKGKDDKWKDSVPKDHEYVGYDTLHKLLITRVQIPDETTMHYQALYEPQKCLDEGLKIAGDKNGLYCIQ